MPANPGAWITQVARNRAIDRLRREGVLRDKLAALERLETLHAEPEEVPGEGLGEIADDRLRLIFTCCHPALAIEARVALTLRSLGGLSTGEIARAFLSQRERHRTAHRPRQAQDRRQRASPTRCPSPSRCPSGCRRCWRPST